MADFKELFTDPVFSEYQDAIIDEVVDWLQHSLKVMADSRELKAGMEVAERILTIPNKLKAPQQIEQRLQAAAKAKLIGIPATLLRRELYDKFKE